MPALRIYGRSWYTTSDMLPLPAVLFAIHYLVYTIVFGVSIAQTGVWNGCVGTGNRYKGTTAGLIAVFAASFLLQLGMVFGGSVGTIFETSRRKSCLILLYLQTGVWIAQFCVMVYGTAILYRNSSRATCGGKKHNRQLTKITHAMVWSAWGQLLFYISIFVILFNSYQGRPRLEAWEKRLRLLSSCLCCTQTVEQADDRRRSQQPLMSIASWIASLFAGVEMSPSDLMAAIFLTAAAQSMRRKMRIRKALKPAAQMSQIEHSTQESDSSDEEDLDAGVPSIGLQMLPAGSMDTDSSYGSTIGQGRSPTHSGRLENLASGRSGVAVPEDYPEELKSKVRSMYKDTAEKVTSKSSKGPTSSSTTSNSGSSPNQTQMLGSDLPGSQAVDTKRGAMEEAMDFSPFQRGKWGGSEGQRSSQIAEPTEEQMTISETAVRRSTGDLSSARDRTSQERRRSLTDSEANRRRRSGQGTISESSSYTRGPKTRRFSMESSRLSSEDETPYVKLSQVSQEELKRFTQHEREKDNATPTPRERFGISSPKRKREDKLDDQVPKDLKTARGEGQERSGKGKKKEEGDAPTRRAHFSPEVAGGSPKKQRQGSTESKYHRQGSMESRLHSVDLQSSTLGKGTQITASMEVLPGEVWGLQDEVVTDRGMINEQVVPLEKDRSGQVPPIITPSEEVVQVVDNEDQLGEVLSKAHGIARSVEYEELDEATNWVRFASAVYAVMPFTEESKLTRSQRRCCGLRQGITEDNVRDSVVEIADIEVDDLLYFSHSNVALSHLPYMVALDRKSKAVVVAIRGTMSLADLVTDAVVDPQPLNQWMPESVRKAKQKAPGGRKKSYGHSGILSAADGVLADLKANGILTTLLEPEKVRSKSLEIMRNRRSGHLPRAQSERPVTQTMQRRRNLDDALSDAEKGMAGPSQRQSGEMRRNTQGTQAGGVWPSKTLQMKHKEAEGNGRVEASLPSKDREGKEMAHVAQTSKGDPEQQGEDTGAALRENLDTKGWKLVITGHSLGGGAACLIALQILERYPDLKCWSFSPPGGLISKSLLRWTENWCTSVVVGKDAVPRMTVNNMTRLMDEMVTSLARCRRHKLRILLGGWKTEKGKAPQNLFFPYDQIPAESKSVLERYHHRANKRAKARDMFPPGKLLFLRPIKMLDKTKEHTGNKNDPPLKQAWDAIWSSPEELVAEGILVSKKMLVHHSITSALIPALGYTMRHHPSNPKSELEKREDKKEEKELQSDLQSVGDEHDGPANPLSGGGSSRFSI